MISRSWIPVALASLLSLVACDGVDEHVPQVCTAGRFETLGPSDVIDVLVVIDTTASMTAQSADVAALGDAIDALLDTRGGADGMDVHVAVVTSDLGVGGVPGCDAAGDGAAFQGAGCGVDGAFLRDTRNGNARLRNYTGDRADALACMLARTASTCPVSQPLAAAVRALDGSVAANAGFHRPGALLAVLVMTDGDDCSLTDPAALTLAAGNDVEGAVDFACFARGASCSPGNPATVGEHSACQPRTDQGLADPRALAARLDELGADWTVISATAASPNVQVIAGPNGPRLASTCEAPGTVRGPAARLSSINNGRGSRAVITTCEMPEPDLIASALSVLRSDLGVPCLPPEIDPATCVATWRTSPDQDADVLRASIPMCSPGAAPGLGQLCWQWFEAGPDCPYGVSVVNGGVVPRGGVEVRCERPCD